MDKLNDALATITAFLLNANVSVPIIGTLVGGIVLLIKGAGAGAPSVSEIADKLEAQIGTTDANIQARIDRLKALLAAT